MPDTRLNRNDWIDAAVDALLHKGPDGVAVQPLARQLGATKGSFYWHFSSRDDLLRAALARWEAVATDDVIAAVEAGADAPGERVALMIAEVSARSQERPGELLLLAGTAHPDVCEAVERVTQRRIDYLARLLRASGLTQAVAARRATLGYAAYVGNAQLSHAVPAVLPASTRGRRALAIETVDAVLRRD